MSLGFKRLIQSTHALSARLSYLFLTMASFYVIRHATVGRTPLDEESARRRDIYLTTHNTHNREISMHQAEFEPAIPVSERPQTHALDRAATGIGFFTGFFRLNAFHV